MTDGTLLKTSFIGGSSQKARDAKDNKTRSFVFRHMTSLHGEQELTWAQKLWKQIYGLQRRQMAEMQSCEFVLDGRTRHCGTDYTFENNWLHAPKLE